MPLSCLDDGRTLHAFNVEGWDALIAVNRARRHLRMACCPAAVTLKTSSRGTRFFAHVARGGCATGDERPEHLWLKQLAVDAARARGWEAATEVCGDGWRADVLAIRGRHRVAVEVQWSPQDDAETLRRQAQYDAAGVRALWLFRQRRFPATAAVPAVRVEGSLATGFTALGLPMTGFLDAVFDRRLRFGFWPGATARTSVAGAVAHCWGHDCGALNRVVVAIRLTCERSRCSLTLDELPLASPLLTAVRAHLPKGRAVPPIGLRRTAERSYVANGCVGCGRFFDAGKLRPAQPETLASFDLPVSADLAAFLAGRPGHAPAWSVLPSAEQRVHLAVADPVAAA